VVTAAVTSHVGRLYATALALVLLFLTWAVVAARPWITTGTDPRLRALAQREARLRVEARQVNAIVARRFAHYRHALAVRRYALAIAAAAPPPAAVRVVNLPPVTITRTS
jgi:hypothetical protein